MLRQVRWSGAMGARANHGRALTMVFAIVAASIAAAVVGSSPASALPAGLVPVAAGEYHTCALTPAGGVKCWGFNSSGQLGDGTNTQRTAPVDVVGLSSGVSALALGGGHSCAINAAGGLVCWGQNSDGQLGNGSTTDSGTPVPVTGLSSGVVAVSLGGFHSCALTTAGAVKCWGANANGQLGIGNNASQSTPMTVSGLSPGVTAVSTGEFFSCALLTGATVKCWGSNVYGQLGNGQAFDQTTPVSVSLLTGVTQLSAGGFHACAIVGGGAMSCWGDGGHGQLGNGTTTGSSTAVPVTGITGASIVEAGRFHTCAYTGTGATCWGWGTDGELGNGGLTDSSTPVPVTGLSTGVAALAAGAFHTCALLTTGAMKCWGNNNQGPVGNGTQTDVSTPSDVIGGAIFYGAPTLGLLRVTTSPAVPSQITVDGSIADTWGLQWVEVPTGSHTVCFGAVPGFTAPGCQTVSVTTGATTTVTGTFVPRGYLRVLTSPAVASQIKVDGVPRNNWGMWTDLATGSHQVCFGAVAGFTPPPCQTVSVTAGGTTTATGTFTASSGSAQSGVGFLRVTTSPAVKSQILVDGVIADSWGLTWMEIGPGSHQVCFTRVEGFTEPGCQTVSVTAGATATVTGAFAARGFLKVETSPAVGGTISIDGAPADAWGLFTDVPTGTHHVCFGPVPGKTPPPCQDPTVTAAGQTTIVGTYT